MPLPSRPEYLEVVWRSLASEDVQCPVVVQVASKALVERLKDPKTYDNVSKDFKYEHLLHPVIYTTTLIIVTRVMFMGVLLFYFGRI